MDDQFRPTSRRQRLVILAVTVGVVSLLWFLLIWRPGGDYRIYIADQPACKPGQTTDCVGGQANVMLIPAQPDLVASATAAASLAAASAVEAASAASAAAAASSAASTASAASAASGALAGAASAPGVN